HLSASERMLIANIDITVKPVEHLLTKHDNLSALADSERLTHIQRLIRSIIRNETGLEVNEHQSQSEFEAELGFESITISSIQERIQGELGDDEKPYAVTL